MVAATSDSILTVLRAEIIDGTLPAGAPEGGGDRGPLRRLPGMVRRAPDYTELTDDAFMKAHR